VQAWMTAAPPHFMRPAALTCMPRPLYQVLAMMQMQGTHTLVDCRLRGAIHWKVSLHCVWPLGCHHLNHHLEGAIMLVDTAQV
jgi:hypothetical protein